MIPFILHMLNPDDARGIGAVQMYLNDVAAFSAPFTAWPALRLVMWGIAHEDSLPRFTTWRALPSQLKTAWLAYRRYRHGDTPQTTHTGPFQLLTGHTRFAGRS